MTRARLTKEKVFRERGQGFGSGEGTRVCVLGTRVDSGDLCAPDHVQNRHHSKHVQNRHRSKRKS